MIITVSVPDNAVKMQYATLESDGYEMWTTLTFGQVIGVQREETNDENA